VAKNLQITLKKSIIGAIPKHKKTVEALGLKKINQVVTKQDNPQMRGMIHQVKHLLEVVEV